VHATENGHEVSPPSLGEASEEGIPNASSRDFVRKLLFFSARLLSNLCATAMDTSSIFERNYDSEIALLK
jgi:hypothetical protein